jgi:hypothetical protein
VHCFYQFSILRPLKARELQQLQIAVVDGCPVSPSLRPWCFRSFVLYAWVSGSGGTPLHLATTADARENCELIDFQSAPYLKNTVGQVVYVDNGIYRSSAPGLSSAARRAAQAALSVRGVLCARILELAWL